MMGSNNERLLHDFNDTFCVLKIHTERLKQSLSHANIEVSSKILLESTALCMEQLNLLIEELRSSFKDERSDEVTPISAALWSQQLQHEILPNLAKIHELDLSFDGIEQSDCKVVMHMPHCARICCNLLANARVAGADHIQVTLSEQAHGIDLIFRDDGRGMTAEQIESLGLGLSSKVGAGHGQGFRIVRKLASDFGAVVRTPVSILGVGTEIRISFMKVGCTA